MSDGIQKKYALIVNGDPQGERHFENVDRAVKTLKAEDPHYQISVASARAPSSPVAARLPADSASLKALIDGLKGRIDDDDLLVVYVTGHGDKGEEEEGCIDLSDGCLSNKVLRDQLNRLPYGKRIVIMDNCFSGGAIPLFSNEKTSMVTAGSPGETVSCQDFSPYLWDEKAPDLDQDGIVTLDERYRHALDRGKPLVFSNYFSLIPSLSFSGREDKDPPFAPKLVTVTDGQQLNKELDRLNPGDLALVLFSADWCDACHAYLPTFDQLARDYGGRFLMIHAEGTNGSEEDWDPYEAHELPTLVFLDAAKGRLRVPREHFEDPKKFLMTFPLLSLSEEQKIEFILKRHGDAEFWNDLLKGIKDPDPTAKKKIRTLMTEKLPPDETVPMLATYLIRFLKDPSPSVRARAAYALGLWGEDARMASPSLVPMIEDADPSVRIESVLAIVRLHFFDPTPKVMKRGRFATISTLTTGGPKFEVLQKTIAPLLDHSDPLIRSEAAQAMRELLAADGPTGGFNLPMTFIYTPLSRRVWGHYLGLSAYVGVDDEGLQAGGQALYGYKWDDYWEWQVKAAASRAEAPDPDPWEARLDLATGPALHWASYFAPVEIVDPYVFGQAGLFYLTNEEIGGVSLSAGLGVRYFLLETLALEASGQATLDVSFSGDTRGGGRFPLGLSYHFHDH